MSLASLQGSVAGVDKVAAHLSSAAMEGPPEGGELGDVMVSEGEGWCQRVTRWCQRVRVGVRG